MRLMFGDAVTRWVALAGLVLAIGPTLVAGRAEAQALVYVAVTPCRVFDTRLGGGGLVAGVSRTFHVVGSTNNFVAQGGKSGGCAIPGYSGGPQAQAVMFNFVAVGAQGAGDLRAWPTDQAAPLASILNYAAVNALNIANGIALPVSQDSSEGDDLTVLADVSGTHVLADVVGYFARVATTTSTSGVGFSAYASAGSGFTRGVYAQADSPGGIGVQGYSPGGRGVQGNTASGTGVYGLSDSQYGVSGEGGNIGVYAHNLTTPAIQAYLATSVLAGDFYGNVIMRNNLSVSGTLTKGGGSFKIDHPVEPADKYLSHSFVESPDMMNIYNGIATLDARGTAVVELPDWFEALNRDFRYQLTCVGGFAPVYVSQKVANNRFRIAGGRKGMEVSWQVTGIRHDAWANAHRIGVEEEKKGADRGRYLNPDLFGQPEEKGIAWTQRPQGEGRATDVVTIR